MVHEILVWPHPLLKQKAQPVAKVDDEIRTLIKDLFESMYAADGVGLAAPQIGVLKNVIVLDTTPRQPEAKPVAMVNPEILSLEGKQTYKEGCLSVPGEAEDVDRAAVVTVRFLDENGDEQTLKCEGLLSVAVQHETDHLKGVMFVDHISTLKRELIRKRMKKLQASMEEDPEEGDDEKPAKRSARAEAR
ncbi:MAG: peptide deformylase [Myxococcaceae bacterium]